jgi:hypothetical protein
MLPIRNFAEALIRPSARYWRAISSTTGRLRSDLTAWADIRSLFPLAVWCGLNCVGTMILVRRWSVPSGMKISTAQWAGSAIVAAALAMIARGLLAGVESQTPSRWMRTLAGSACAFPLAALAAAAPPRTGLAGYVFLAALVAGAWVLGAIWDRRLGDRLFSAAISPAGRARGRLAMATARLALEGDASPGASSARPHLLRLERLVLPAGDELIQGVAAAHFAAGQGLAEVHVAFCPPLPRTPEVTCEIADDDGIRLKLGGAYPWGCRFDLKRTGELSSARRAMVHFRAVVRATSRAAA